MPLPYHCKMSFSLITLFLCFIFPFSVICFCPHRQPSHNPLPALAVTFLPLYGHFINKSSVSVTQAFTHLAIGMQFSFQALILLYEVMELMRFYPVPPTHNLSISPHFPRQTSTPPSVANLSVFSLASPALLTRGNLFKDQINIST